MIEGSNKNRFKKDIHTLKIQGYSNTVNNMETQTVRTVTFLAQYAQIRNFTKHIFKKHKIYCHNLFLLDKEGPTRYPTLQC